eukprot:CAMPEP_0182418562 /NCGR_PEP_ID=MMETSP1167-20130531/2963_1 /TAXON_ID=2988 /ORGANISM="Mallomonas Sp, Strain CCMP3275" /LENGTH=362 /DNA_ID=CAMNT_0024592825 /DNA_START=307 /DNA_END=1395 /DNA_ORIENTATION=-
MTNLFSAAKEAHLKGSKKQSDLLKMIDVDTVVMWGTQEAAYRAVGAVIAAVDDVSTSSNKMAFCCVRPPGHHAERNRACGFCFFNNAAIGARHAQEVYGIEKVAVVDFDVHHGNGTEEGFAPYNTLFYGSTHEQYAFPGSGEEPHLKANECTSEIDRRIVNRYLHAGPNSKEEFRVKWKEVLSEMERFQPGLVIVSAGFDAHDEDPLASCELLDEDYTWATQQLCASLRRINPDHPPPCVSVLEGGYDLNALASSAVAHCKVLAAGPPPLSELLQAEKEEESLQETPSDLSVLVSSDDRSDTSVKVISDLVSNLESMSLTPIDAKKEDKDVCVETEASPEREISTCERSKSVSEQSKLEDMS